MFNLTNELTFTIYNLIVIGSILALILSLVVVTVQYVIITHEIYKMDKQQLRKNIEVLNMIASDERLKNI